MMMQASNGMLDVQKLQDGQEERTSRKEVLTAKNSSIKVLQLHPLCIIRIKIYAFLPPPFPRSFSSTYSILQRFLNVTHTILNG